MKKGLMKISIMLSLSLLWALNAHAVTITSIYTVDANSADPGLVIQTGDLAPQPFTFNLEEGETFTYDLFSIWTDESAINYGEDTIASPIEVFFSFTMPDILTGSVGGETKGKHKLGGLFQGGKVAWGDPLSIFYGDHGDGLMEVSLSDESFNWGVFGTLDGQRFGDDVEASFTLVKTASVPEPATVGLMALGLLGLTFSRKRRTDA